MFLLLATMLLGGTLFGQDSSDKLYVIMEMMHVDNEQETAYAETENFWEKIHQQRVQSGEIIGWDLWSLLPGGEDQNYQYMTVTLFNDPVKMFQAMDLLANAKKAYPNMAEEDLINKLNSSAKSRDLAVRIFMEVVATTKDDFQMAPGMVAIMNMMKVGLENYGAYEKAETEVFLPMHQQQVDAGRRGSWVLARFMMPYGSATYASHITVDMYKDMAQALGSMGGGNGGSLTPAQQKAITDGLATRDLKFASMGILMKMVR
jgi:hypothetical protein